MPQYVDPMTGQGYSAAQPQEEWHVTAEQFQAQQQLGAEPPLRNIYEKVPPPEMPQMPPVQEMERPEPPRP